MSASGEGAGGSVGEPLRSDRPVLGIVTICVGMFVMMVQDAMVKWLTATYPVLEIMFLRAVMMLPIVLFFIIVTQGPGGLRTGQPRAHLLRSLIGFLTFICFFTAVSLMPLADVIAIVFASPLFVTLLSGPLLGERVGWRRWAAVLVGFVGVLIMVGPSGTGTEFWPAMIALASSVFYALWVLQTRRMAARESASVMVFYGVAFFSVASLVGAPFGWIMPDLGDLWMFLCLALISTVGLTLVTQAYRLAPASVVVPFDYTAMIWAILLGYWIWNDLPTPTMIAGALLVIGSGLFILHREMRAGKGDR